MIKKIPILYPFKGNILISIKDYTELQFALCDKCKEEKVRRMKCPKCNSNLRLVRVAVEGAKHKAISLQCTKCNYFEFDEKSSAEVVKELKSRESPLKIRQKIIKLSKGRLGMYINKSIVESLELKAGEEVQVSVPDKNHIVLKIQGNK